jgi:guanylate cyclase soluble subunit beta
VVLLHYHINQPLTANPGLLPLAGSAPDAPPTPVLVFLASPRVRSLLEMQQSSIYLSDIPLHDMTSDYILLAEQRHAEADLKEKYEKLTVELKVRK